MKSLAWIGLFLTLILRFCGLFVVFVHDQPNDLLHLNLFGGGNLIVVANILLLVSFGAFLIFNKTT